MLGKLMTYELRALWKPAAIMLAIMVVAGIAGTACLGATRAISEVSWGAYGSLATPTAGNATVVLFMGALFCAFLVWAAVVAFYVFSSMRFYRTLFTDEGYLALTLPVPTGTLVMAKFWVSYLVLAAFALMALLAYTLMALAVSGGDIDAVTGVASMMGGWFAFAADGDGASALLGYGNMLVTCAYDLSLAYGSLTLGAWWARRHKVAAAVGVYLGVGWALSLVFSIAGVLVMSGDTTFWDFALGAVAVVQMLMNLAVAVGSLALSTHLIRTKVDLS